LKIAVLYSKVRGEDRFVYNMEKKDNFEIGWILNELNELYFKKYSIISNIYSCKEQHYRFTLHNFMYNIVMTNNETIIHANQLKKYGGLSTANA